ncbi:phosphate ABC transporter, inner membrane subunit PstC [Desulfarculus baarsii DSM 2075]|uniref:Phosphate transport system permease protein n=1 Tax=Desulfarculus baarsii (strain ATCC 33931 / DSM 2075 / LMG 7858 / VKM B-1802 / 2st14) TaxID=644282 RepID=E1QIK7_DESB2|nr:phosphate ABC transporter permease subunit PstC [Desulfarculus baarsii]ADK84430.1 phosphate ABC transporter, inner membrane subunit PstC [Desulfarculus baarsii DSM 2075]
MTTVSQADSAVIDDGEAMELRTLPQASIASNGGPEREVWIRRVFIFCGLFSLLVMGLIVVFLFSEGAGVLGAVSLGDFLLGHYWYPTYEPPDLGILPLIVGSASVTLVSSAIAVPLGVGAALYIGEVAGHRAREIIKPGVELLASLPSVVLGFVGMVIIAPELQRWLDVPSGLNILSASLMLAIMAIPTITSISEDALRAVPGDLREASLALGATRWETLRKVQVPAALSGIGTGVILGMSRAMGETMVVLMVAGGAAQIPSSIFDSVRPMPATIAAEMGETPVGSAHYHALFAIAIVLFMMTLGFNLVAAWISKKYQQKGSSTL